MSTKSFYQFFEDGVRFRSSEAVKLRTVYAPLCGPDGINLKSSITPCLSGDVKLDKFRYLTKPVSTEDLRNDLRNFFVHVDGQGVFCLTRETLPSTAEVEIGQLWHKLTRHHPSLGLSMTAFNVIPVNGDNVELMRVTLANRSDKTIRLTPTSCFPMFCRALANKHDHEHVTSLLNRIEQCSSGVVVRPTMKFDEEGHHLNQDVYFALGVDGEGGFPVGSFPTTDSFFGEGGHTGAPQAVVRNARPVSLSTPFLQGKEAVGALRFATIELSPNSEVHYFLVNGIASGSADPAEILARYHSPEKFQKVINEVEAWWRKKSTAIEIRSGNSDFNAWMRWVTIQPVLRRIFGCSFLPDHDYGKGGKGWRDIWQDLLSLILIEPESIRESLLNNFAGVRIDGSNATIIGERPGEFLADRNAITRVWMDHGVWPLMTVLLYLHQTGDVDFLFAPQTYFCDSHQSRTFKMDWQWTPAQGSLLKTMKDKVYYGTVLEHLLVQNLIPFFNVGEHNCIRLESADWNDGLDMAFQRGESVAFTSAYAGNLLALAELLRHLESIHNVTSVTVVKELMILLDTVYGDACDYSSVVAKKKVLFETYFPAVEPRLSGETVQILVADMISDLERKAKWMREHLRANERINVGGMTWYNGYYDNQAQRVEGQREGRVWMTLTGQVFPVMSGVATDEDVAEIVHSVRHYLRDPELGGFRLNTDFGIPHYLDLGRAFGFAYGTKENGAFFSHMAVMYAFALYSRGLSRDGFEVLNSLYQMSADRRARIYPGLPEYMDSLGRGMYHYLTGSASWFVLTLLTQAFGIRGQFGDLRLSPQLVKEQFDGQGRAAVFCHFAGVRLEIVYENMALLDAGNYRVGRVFLEQRELEVRRFSSRAVFIPREKITACSDSSRIKVELLPFG